MSKRPRMNHATGVQGEGSGGGHERGPDHRGVIPAVPGSSEFFCGCIGRGDF